MDSNELPPLFHTDCMPSSLISAIPDHPLKPKLNTFDCSYDGCHKSFSSKSDLDRHMRVHTGEKPFICPICQKSFSQRGTLNRHKELHMHKRYKCSYCDKTFTTSTNCKQHERIHKGEKPYQCTYPGCSNAYPSAASLNYHLKTHLGVRNYVCSCGKRFLTANNLNKHAKTHLKAKYNICNICSKEFDQINELTNHMTTCHKTTFTIDDLYKDQQGKIKEQAEMISKYQAEIARLKEENDRLINDNHSITYAYKQLQNSFSISLSSLQDIQTHSEFSMNSRGDNTSDSHIS
ncbi:hypothetical protein WA158_007271 [Blastocystis sp. Blastoise]